MLSDNASVDYHDWNCYHFTKLNVSQGIHVMTYNAPKRVARQISETKLWDLPLYAINNVTNNVPNATNR